MPIYEYECLDNGHHFEVMQKITDNHLKSCTICNSPVRRLISPTAFHLKGGGWYAQGYGSSSSPSAKTSTSEKPSAASSTPAPVTKPEPKVKKES